MTLNQVVQQMEPNKRTSAKKLVVEIGFMERTLRRLRREIDDNPVTEAFVQGAQNFRREQPAIKSYNSMVARYGTLHKQFIAMLPRNVEVEDDDFDKWASAYENDMSK